MIGVMPIRRPADIAPDLFSDPPSPKAPGPSAVVQAQGAEDDPASQPRHMLPKDLAGALVRLDDSEIDALLAAVTGELRRRGRWLPSAAKVTPASAGKPRPLRASAEDSAVSLTTGKLNAVRAAFKAGVRPSAIARQFGISQSDVRKALATGAWDQRSGR